MFIIVEQAAEGHWERNFDVDPNYTGLHPVYAVKRTVEGCRVPMQYSHDQYNQAVKDCELLNKENPTGGYAVVRSL